MGGIINIHIKVINTKIFMKVKKKSNYWTTKTGFFNVKNFWTFGELQP